MLIHGRTAFGKLTVAAAEKGGFPLDAAFAVFSSASMAIFISAGMDGKMNARELCEVQRGYLCQWGHSLVVKADVWVLKDPCSIPAGIFQISVSSPTKKKKRNKKKKSDLSNTFMEAN